MRRAAALCAAYSRWQIRVRGLPVRNHHLLLRAAHSTSASPDPPSNDSRGPRGDPYDVVIVGGGMVGAAVGCGLASSPLTRSLRVAIIDGSPLEPEKPLTTPPSPSPSPDSVPDSRVSAITPSTVSFLKEVGAWETVVENRHAAFDSMQVWDYTGRGFTRYEAADVGEDVLGYVVENNVLVSSLRTALQRAECAEMISPAQVKGVGFPASHEHEAGDGWAQVLLEDGRVLQSRLVVGADGGRSKVRAFAGVKSSGWEYGQHALICTVRVGNVHSTAWQRFLSSGPLALLPMGGFYSNIVWSTTPERAQELKAMSEMDFVRATNEALTENHRSTVQESQLASVLSSKWLSPLLGEHPLSAGELFQSPPLVTECLTPRLSFPLSLKHANRYVSTRSALVGDAAHTVHPLAGQGVNLGFGDAASLVKTIGDGVKTGADIGQMGLLRKYERDRMWANVPMMAVLDGFQRVFSTDFLPINLARAVGFSAANYVGPLKKQIISFAMGK